MLYTATETKRYSHITVAVSSGETGGGGGGGGKMGGGMKVTKTFFCEKIGGTHFT